MAKKKDDNKYTILWLDEKDEVEGDDLTWYYDEKEAREMTEEVLAESDELGHGALVCKLVPVAKFKTMKKVNEVKL